MPSAGPPADHGADHADHADRATVEVRVLLWLCLGVAILALLACVVVLPQRLALFSGPPALVALLAAVVALRRVRSRESVRLPAAVAGGAVALVGLLTATVALGFVAIVTGVLMLLVALARGPRQ